MLHGSRNFEEKRLFDIENPTEFRGKFRLPVDAFVLLCLPFGILTRPAEFEREAEILKFIFVNIHVISSGFYNCKATIVIYTCILTRDTRVNSSVENTFVQSLYVQAGLYTLKFHG